MSSSQNGGSTLMDLISADPTTSGGGAGQQQQQQQQQATSSSTLPAGLASLANITGARRSFKKSSLPNLLQLPGDGLISPGKILSPATKAVAPTKQKKKPLSYAQLARTLHELAATADQKSSQKQLLHHVFPKLAVYSSVDPSLAPSLIMLHQQADDRQVLRYVYYFLSRILGEVDSQGVTPGGGIPTPNWDALADMSVAGGVTRADVLPRILSLLTAEASNDDISAHSRRVAALKTLACAAATNSDVITKLYEIVFGILDKVADAGKIRRKKGRIFGRQTLDKESVLRSNLQYAALSTLQKLPIDQGNPAFLHRAVQGIACADPVGVRHALAMVSEMAPRDPYGVATAVAKLSLAGGSLQDVLTNHDVMARVYLARLCHALASARVLDEVQELRAQFRMILYQLLLDPSERVCFEAISCILGKFTNNESSAERAAGWTVLSTAILKFPELPLKEKDANVDEVPPKLLKEAMPMPRPRRPQPMIKLVMRRLEAALRSSSRPVLHAAVRIIQELGKSRAAAFSHGVAINEDFRPDSSIDNSGVNSSELDNADERKLSSVASSLTGANKESISNMLSSLMEAVRTTIACECVYVRAAAIKALIWLQRPDESVDELKAIISGELSDPCWPASLVSDILLSLHARFKATPEMAVILLDISRLFATKVPGKIDSDVLQLLWKTCLVGCGPSGKHTALEAVTVVLDLPPPAPVSMKSSSLQDRVSAFDPKAATALLRLVQAAVWFLGENANYAAAEYAWESKMPPGTALMMLDGDKMVAAASSRNPTLVGALTRLQRCALSGNWEVRIVAAQALITVAIRSGEPYRLQIYEFLHTLAKGTSTADKFGDLYASCNGEDQGASGSGLSSILAPMLRVLDEMYTAQDQLIKDMRQHENTKKEWSDDELRILYETHERLLDVVSLFCFVPRSKYLPLGPTSAGLITIYRNRHHIDAATGFNDPAVATGISDLVLPYTFHKTQASAASAIDDDISPGSEANLDSPRGAHLVNEYLVGGGGTEAPEVEDDNALSHRSINYDDMWAKTLLQASDDESVDDRSSGSSSPESTASFETAASSRFGSSRFSSIFNQPPRRESEASATLSSLAEDVKQPEDDAWKSNFRREDSIVISEDGSTSAVHEAGKALYDFTAGGDDELSIVSGDDLEIEYEVDGWYFVRKKKPGRDGKMSGLVPVLYVGY